MFRNMRLLFILTHTDLTGVSTFNYTCVSALSKKYKDKIKIDVLLPTKDCMLSSKLQPYCNVITEITHNNYDIVYFNYENNDGLFECFENSDKRFFVHGLMGANNIPVNKYDKVYCFGERSLDYIKSENKILIRNYIDCERFNLKNRINEWPEKILIHSSRDSQILLSPVIAAAGIINSFVSFSGSDFLNRYKSWEVETKIQFSDMVVGYGRSLIEAMAMGKAALLFGVNGGEGIVTPKNFFLHATTNFSGWIDRKLKFDLTEECVEGLYHEMIKYNLKDIKGNYELVQDNFDIHKNLNKIL
jgi:hypothetical protein